MITVHRYVVWAALAAILLTLLVSPAHASQAQTGLEWEGPIRAIVNSISGPVAFAIALLGIVVCGFVLIWGGEINEFVRRMVMMIMVVSVIMFAAPLLNRLFAGGASLITAPVHQAISTPGEGR